MVSVGFLAVFLSCIPFLVFIFSQCEKWSNDVIPWNWPILGMIPAVITYIGHRAHDRVTEVLEAAGCTFLYRGIWFTNTDYLFTVDPSNIHHILSTNFERYPKGPDFKYIFDILGDGIFNSDAEPWKNHRRIANSLVHSPKFLELAVKTTKQKIEQALLPVLESISKTGSVVDLQDLFQRFSFDSTCMMVTGFDFNSLSTDFPEVPFSKAMDDAGQIIFLRHIIPRNLWELQEKLAFGAARRLNEARKTLDQTIAELLSLKRKQLQENEDVGAVDLITSYINDKYDDKFLRDTVMNFMLAGRDTLTAAISWFFFCISNNPAVETKIREELKAIIPADEPKDQRRVFSIEELNKLVYLHGALCETLRLYPPVPFQHKVPVSDDILPSGHHVNPKIKIIFSLYALGRMTSVWGKDSMEFKPERWITERGTIRHVPSYKFLAFNAGPRTCLGKEVAFIEMKMAAAAFIHNFSIQQIGHNVASTPSIILLMKHGFKVKVTSRWSQ